jgi:hypothetical protein
MSLAATNMCGVAGEVTGESVFERKRWTGSFTASTNEGRMIADVGFPTALSHRIGTLQPTAERKWNRCVR